MDFNRVVLSWITKFLIIFFFLCWITRKSIYRIYISFLFVYFQCSNSDFLWNICIIPTQSCCSQKISGIISQNPDSGFWNAVNGASMSTPFNFDIWDPILGHHILAYLGWEKCGLGPETDISETFHFLLTNVSMRDLECRINILDMEKR